MAHKFFYNILILLSVFIFASCNLSFAEQKDLGGLAPEEALEYMKGKANDLILIDVAPRRWFERETFNGAIHVPAEEMSGAEHEKIFMDLPADKPVLLYCRMGRAVPKMYETLKILRPDIIEISYIAGAPMFKEYNDWLQHNVEVSKK